MRRHWLPIFAQAVILITGKKADSKRVCRFLNNLQEWMRILVDADGFPVVDSTTQLANAHEIECLPLCDTSRVFEKDGAKTPADGSGHA
jgi:hypothetical protein